LINTIDVHWTQIVLYQNALNDNYSTSLYRYPKMKTQNTFKFKKSLIV
jgi:hypothetical protein